MSVLDLLYQPCLKAADIARGYKQARGAAGASLAAHWQSLLLVGHHGSPPGRSKACRVLWIALLSFTVLFCWWHQQSIHRFRWGRNGFMYDVPPDTMSRAMALAHAQLDVQLIVGSGLKPTGAGGPNTARPTDLQATKLRVFVNVYRPKSHVRIGELLASLDETVSNPLVDHVHVFGEEVDLPFFLDHPKVTKTPIVKRPTFADFFTWMRAYPEDVVALLNSDVALPSSPGLRSALQLAPWLRSSRCLAGTSAPPARNLCS